MSKRKGRVLLAIVAGGVAGWWVRLAAHSKAPPAEGRWREFDPRDRT